MKMRMLIASALLAGLAGADEFKPYGYLFCHMDGPNNEFVSYALATNDLVFTDVKGGAAIFDSAELSPIEKGSRDPYVFRRHDGKGYLMTCTDMSNRLSRKWINFGIDLLTSDDLVTWKSTAFDFRKGPSIFCDPESPDVYPDWSKVERVWAPQAVWDPDYVWPDGRKGGYLVYYSMLNRAVEPYDRVYYSHADESFTRLTKPRLFFDWGYATIDADITPMDAGGYRMLIKKEGGTPGIFVTHADKVTGPWLAPDEKHHMNLEGRRTCEGASAFKLFDTGEWRFAYVDLGDNPHPYRICKTDDAFSVYRDPENIKGVARPQHGSFLTIDKAEYDRLAALTPPEGEFTPYGVAVDGVLQGEVEKVEFADGFAVRYRLPGDKRHITDEMSVWKLPEDARVWYQVPACDTDYEAPHLNALVKDIPPGTRVNMPLTAKLADGTYRLITEANLVNYTDAELIALGHGRFRIRYYADRKGFTQTGEGVTPWRVTIVATNLNQLANCDMVRRLCPEPPADRVARAKQIAVPGRSVWQWLPAGAPKLSEQREWIDRTAELGYEYYLIDEGWRGWKDGEKDKWACLKEVIAYATRKGVKCAIWVHSNEMPNRARRLDYLKRTKDAGAVGIKIDFMPPCNHHWCRWYEETLEDTFAVGLFVDFHGAVKPTGREKTWPHELAREAVRGHEWHITRYNRILPYDHDTILPFTRLVQGHADYTPLVFEKSQLIHFTWARQLAQGIIFSAPFFCTGDFPKNYLENPALDLIRELQPVYDETIVLPGSEIGACVAMAKRKGNVWFIAVENGAEPRELTLDFAFLKPGRVCTLEGFGDAPDRLDAYTPLTRTVKRGDKLTISLRKGGGFAGWLKPKK